MSRRLTRAVLLLSLACVTFSMVIGIFVGISWWAWVLDVFVMVFVAIQRRLP